MRIEYTPEEVRTLVEEHEPLRYESATDADLAEAADVLEGIEELVARLDPQVRREALEPVSRPLGEHLWIPVADNCTRTAGVAIAPDGSLSFAVRGEGEGLVSYFAARRAAGHALASAGPGEEQEEAADHEAHAGARGVPKIAPPSVADDDPVVVALKANGRAIAAGRTLADVDPGVLRAVYPLSEAGEAHLFASEAGGGVVLALAGATAGDRRRAVEGLAELPERRHSSRGHSVLFEGGEAGGHYSEESWFGHSLTEAPPTKEAELDAAAERLRASRFVRPSRERPLDVAAIRRRVRRRALVRAAVGHAVAVDTADAPETLRRLVGLVLVARHSSRAIVGRALAAERPWDSGAERGRMEKAGRGLRREIVAGVKARDGKPVPVTPTAVLDAERRERLAGEATAEDPKLRRAVERRRKSGRAAYDTARAVYLQRCPELEHKLLHILRRDGAQPEREFVSRRRNLAGDASGAAPEAAVFAALRTLAEAGKAKRVRSQKTGEVFVAATEPLDETGYRRSLNGLIRDERYGIVNPWAVTAAVEADGELDEWQRGSEDLEEAELARLAPKRLRDTTSYERPLPAADLVAEPAALEEIDSIA